MRALFLFFAAPIALVACSRPPVPPEAAVNQTRLMDSLKSLPTKRAARGDIPHQQGLVATEELLARELRAMGYTPELQPLTWNLRKQAELETKLGGSQVDSQLAPETTDELATRTWHNIIVEIRGTDLASEVLILGAHFD